MRKIIDRVFISLLILLPLLVWALYLTRSLWQSVVLSVAVTVLLNLIWIGISTRLNKKRTPSKIEIFKLLSALGTEETTALLYNSLPPDMRSELTAQTFILNKDTLVFNNIKFAPSNEEDIAKMYRLCKARGLTKAIFIANRTERKLMAFAAYLGIAATFPDRLTIKQYLVRHNALPAPPQPVKIKLPKYKLKELLSLVIDRRKAKYYIFSGLMLLLMSLLTPLKLYYLIFASLPLLLATISLLTTE